MARRRRRTIPRLAALLAALVVLGACSAKPVSQAVESALPATAAPPSGSPAQPPSEAPPASPASSPAMSPAAPATAAARIPDKPAKVTWKEIDREKAGGATRVTHRITWSAPKDVATRFTVVGVTECLREGAAFKDKPCLVRGMRIPKNVQEVVAQVPGSARSVDIAWKEPERGRPPYAAILIRASNDAGDSIFTIVWSDEV